MTFSKDGEPRAGAVVGGGIVDLAHASGGRLPTDLGQLVAAGEEMWKRLRGVVTEQAASLPLVESTMLAPLPSPRRNLFAVGRNYLEHVQEGAAARDEATEVPTMPVFFTKATNSVIGPNAPIPLHAGITEKLDWEAELAVVIGRGGKNIPAEHALDHVFGYTAANDISARDLQFGHTQWFKGKSLDGSCPLGPALVTADELGDPQSLEIECRLNGTVKQKSNTSLMIFAVPVIIEWLSAGLTLEPGDVILTGTPSGVGFARTPPEFLRAGDVIEVEIEKIGVLRNHINGDEAASHG